MSTILTTAIVDDAKSAVDTYNSSVQTLNSDLETTLNALTHDNFVGDASNGYYEFYTGKVRPALTENLIDNLMGNIKSILDSIRTQLLDTVDPQLGTDNRNQ